MNEPCGELFVRLGKAPVDAMFDRQDEGPVIDDSEFLPLVESVLTAIETARLDGEIVEELWEYGRFPVRSCLQGSRTDLNDGGKHPPHAELPAGTTPDQPTK